MKDTKLIAKLSEGEMFARDATYHKSCMTAFYNKSRISIETSNTKELRRIEGAALSDVIHYVKDSIASMYETDPDVEPVFKQSELYQIYKNRLVAHGASVEFAKKSQCTRMSDDIIEIIPGLIKTKNNVSNVVVLTINYAPGKAIFQACYSSVQDAQFLINQAAKAIRKELFKSSAVFDGDVSIKRQKESVPNCLTKLVGLILEGEKADIESSPGLERIATNIAQLIRFHAVKERRAVNSSRPSSEVLLLVAIGLRVFSDNRSKKLINDLAAEGLSISYKRVKAIRKAISNQVCTEYQDSGLVCPNNLQFKMLYDMCF